MHGMKIAPALKKKPGERDAGSKELSMLIVPLSKTSGTPEIDPAHLADLLGSTVPSADDAFDSYASRIAEAGNCAPPTAQPAALPRPHHAPQHDPVAAVAFLKWLDPNGWHTLWAQHPETGANTGRTFAPNSWDEIAVFVNAQQGRNVYFTVNEPNRDAPNKKLTKEHIENVRAVWGDFDPDESLELAGKGAAERERIEALTAALLADAVAPPSFIIDSGGGHQALWRLDRKLSADEFGKQCEDQNKGIIVRFGGDKTVWNLDRVLRVPGTVNFPDAKKRARGRVTRQATLVAQNHTPATVLKCSQNGRHPFPQTRVPQAPTSVWILIGTPARRGRVLQRIAGGAAAKI